MDVGGQTPSLNLPLINLTFSLLFIPFSPLSLSRNSVSCHPSLFRFSFPVALTSEENLRLCFLARKRGAPPRSMLSLCS